MDLSGYCLRMSCSPWVSRATHGGGATAARSWSNSSDGFPH